MKTCAVGHCLWPARRYGLCVPHALTWALTPEFRLPDGPRSTEALGQFVARQEVRHALRASGGVP